MMKSNQLVDIDYTRHYEFGQGELSRFAGRALQSHVMAMYREMKYCRNTPEQGLFMKATVR
jgi:hypothetical protein